MLSGLRRIGRKRIPKGKRRRKANSPILVFVRRKEYRSERVF